MTGFSGFFGTYFGVIGLIAFGMLIFGVFIARHHLIDRHSEAERHGDRPQEQNFKIQDSRWLAVQYIALILLVAICGVIGYFVFRAR